LMRFRRFLVAMFHGCIIASSLFAGFWIRFDFAPS
jgi:hypothetical protein